MNKLIYYEVDLTKKIPLTLEQQKELQALANMPEEDIDCSDIAPLDANFWKNAVQNPFYKPTKTSTTIRIDADVLAWLKRQGKGYQTRINTILRSSMLESLPHL